MEIDDRIRRLKGNTKSIEADHGTHHEGVAAAVREEIAQTRLKGSTLVPEGMRKETKSQQKKDYLDHEKGNGNCEERSRIQVPKDVVVTHLKKMEERNTKLEDNVTQMKERLPAEEKTTKEVQTSSLGVNKRIRRLKEMTKSIEADQGTIDEGVGAAVREEIAQTKLKESTIVPEGMRKETNCQQKKDYLDHEKGNGNCEERSRIQVPKDVVVTNLKKVEERNTKLEDNVTQMKERLPAEEKTTKEVQTSSLGINDRIRRLKGNTKSIEADQGTIHEGVGAAVREEIAQTKLKESTNLPEGMRKETRSQQKKLKDKLDEEKVSREERLRVQVETKKKMVEERYTKLDDEVRQLTERLLAEERISKELQTSSLKNFITSLRQVQSVINEELDNIIEHSLKVNQLDSVQMKQNNESLERRSRRRTREKKSALMTKMHRRHAPENMCTPVEKMQQETVGYTTDSTTDNEGTSEYVTARDSVANIQHDEPNFTSDSATDYEDARSYVFDDTNDTDTVKWDFDDEEYLDEQSKLEVCARVSVEGANLKIAETGVSLFIPPGALSEEQTIHMKIIPQPCDAKSALKFECNSVVVVELLPNNCRFKCPVSLTLPHCLHLKKEYERNSIDVLISHHEEGFKPKWEILHDAKFYLWKENCTISLHSFCWVTYEIHDTIVEAKRIKLYTAGKKMRLKDRITEVEVGFYPDLPGSGKILELNKDMHLSQRKPYVFLKTDEEPLLINLHKVVPKQWINSQPDENPKIIPFDSVSISEERSCPFVLEKSGDDTDIPLCIFKVGQKGRNEVELTIRPDVLKA